MFTCTRCGNTLMAGDQFCTSCGTPVAVAPPPAGPAAEPGTGAPTGGAPMGMGGAAANPPPGGLPSPGAPPNASAPAGVSQPPRSGGDWRRPWLFGAIAVVVVAVAVGSFVLLRGDDGTTSTADGFSGPNTDLVLLGEYTADGVVDAVMVATLGSDDAPVMFSDDLDGFVAAGLHGAAGSATSIALGGPTIATIGSEGEYAVVEFDPSSGETTTLFEGSNRLAASYAPDDDMVFVTEYRGGSDNRCYAGERTEVLRRIARAELCVFSPSGQYVLAADLDDDEYSYTVVETDGGTVLRGTSIQRPEFLPDDLHLVATRGSSDRYAARIVSISSGETVAESARGTSVVALDTDGADRVLVASVDDDGTALLEVLSASGEVRDVVSNEGPISAAFLAPDDDDIIIHLVSEDGQRVSTARLPDDGTEIEIAPIADADHLDVLVDPGAGRFLAASRDNADGGPVDAVLSVGTDAGVIEVDVDDFDQLHGATLSANGAVLFVAVSTFDGESSEASVLTVDLADGTHEWAIDGWGSARVVDIDQGGELFLVAGRENPGDDDVTLVSVERATGEVELVEQGQFIQNAAYTSDGRSVVFTISDGDDVETSEYELGERVPATTLYRDLGLFQHGWEGLEAPVRLSALESLEVVLPDGRCPIEFPDARVLGAGGTQAGSISPGATERFCLQVESEGTYTIGVSSDFDPTLLVEGPYPAESGSAPMSEFNDAANGLDPEVVAYLVPGAYTVEVAGFGDSSGTYTIEASS